MLGGLLLVVSCQTSVSLTPDVSVLSYRRPLELKCNVASNWSLLRWYEWSWFSSSNMITLAFFTAEEECCAKDRFRLLGQRDGSLYVPCLCSSCISKEKCGPLRGRGIVKFLSLWRWFDPGNIMHVGTSILSILTSQCRRSCCWYIWIMQWRSKC